MIFKRLFVFFISSFCLVTTGRAQFMDSGPFEVGIFGGVSTYNGDLQAKNITYQQSHPAFGIFLRKEIHKGFGLELGVNFGKLSGADSLATDSARSLRNLDFQSNVLDVHLLVTYNIPGLENTRFTPYVFAGVAVYHFDPYTYYMSTDSTRDRYYLQPLHTEGQGLEQYPDRKPYSLTQFAIPFGVGVKYAVSSRVDVGAVLSMRKTFTDYIDDVSKTYVDQTVLASGQGIAAVHLSYRGDELPGHQSAPYPPEGTMRGSSLATDFYFFTGVKLSIKLLSKSKAAQRALQQVACPPSSY